MRKLPQELQPDDPSAQRTKAGILVGLVARVKHIFRWDLDKTYLKTEFDTLGDIVRIARMSAEERQNIPGSAAMIRAIRDGTDETQRHLIYFISGSPEQLRPVIERKFALDGFIPDGFVLKPTVTNILRGRFRAVRGHVGYKLAELLHMRTEAPVGTAETLFGDDAESDAFVYSLYADLIAGRVPRGQLRTILKSSGAYPSQIRAIEDHYEGVVREDPVQRIVIHLDNRTPPAAFSAFFPRLVPIYNHLQTAIVLYLDETLPAQSIATVALELLSSYGFDRERLTHLAEDILRRRRPYTLPARLEALAADLRTVPLNVDANAHEATTNARTVLDNIADRAEHLLRRPRPPGPERWAPRTDYEALWREDRIRQAEAKRARRLAAKVNRRRRLPARASVNPPKR